MSSNLPDLFNSLDGALATITRLSELAPALDGSPEYFANCIEILGLIEQQAAHAERISSQLAHLVLPRPRLTEDQP
jgi:hypothetical protein